MIDLPLSDKISVNTDGTTVVDVTADERGSILYTVQSIAPNQLGKSIDIEYPLLSYEEALALEVALRGTRGAERLLWNGLRYLIKDDITFEYFGRVAKASLTLILVG